MRILSVSAFQVAIHPADMNFTPVRVLWQLDGPPAVRFSIRVLYNIQAAGQHVNNGERTFQKMEPKQSTAASDLDSLLLYLPIQKNRGPMAFTYKMPFTMWACYCDTSNSDT